MKKERKSAKLILQESEKQNSGQNDRFMVFCRNPEKYHLRTYLQNIRVGGRKFFFVFEYEYNINTPEGVIPIKRCQKCKKEPSSYKIDLINVLDGSKYS